MKDMFIQISGSYLFIFVIFGLIVALVLSKREVRLRFLLSILVAGVIAYCTSIIASHIHQDVRPFVLQHITPLIGHTAENGFPSDHALLTMTLTVITFFFDRRIAGLMLIATILVGVARVMALVHSPVDIAAGWLIGAVGATAAFYAVRAAWPQVMRALHRLAPWLTSPRSPFGE